MYCECSNKNNYEVISLCDIKKFSSKNGPFNNKPWAQISIADILTLDCNKLAIEKIEKIYIDVSITSTKIIETPISSGANSEGLILTGKKLLIDGFICSKIVYTSLTREQSVYTSKFMVPFCTYVVIDANADLFNDKYCIKTCIEDVFLSLIDCKTIFQNITLFLFAEKISIICPNPQLPKEDCTITNNINPPVPTNFPNDIILNALDNTTVLTISFNTSNNRVTVAYTGKITDPSGNPNYFKFTLYNDDKTTEKSSATIGGNTTGMNFSNILSNTEFQYGDIIKLQYQANDKVIITNFPTYTTPRYTPRGTEESFRIIRTGLIPAPSPNILPNIIFFKTSTPNEKEIALIEFARNTKKLIVTSTGITATTNYPAIGSVTIPPPQSVFLLRLRDSSNSNIKASSVIDANENASKFQTELNDQSFEFGDILEVYSLNEPATTITNFPTTSQSSPLTGDNIGNGVRAFFKITQSGLQKYTPTTEPSFTKLQTDMVIRDDNNNIIGSIFFDTTKKIFYLTGFNKNLSADMNFTLEIGISNQNSDLITTPLLSGPTSISSFVKAINFLKFDTGYFIRINRLTSPSITNNLIVTNYTSFDPLHRVRDGERFEITAQGLVNPVNPNPNPTPMLQEIIIGVSPRVSRIQFDTNNKKVIVISTGSRTEPLFSPTAIFLVKIRDSSGQNIKTSALIRNGENANNFRTTLNDADFEFGDILDLEAYFADDNSITNFPTTGQFHRLGAGLLTGENVHEFFKLTAQGLQAYTPPSKLSKPKLPNEIIVKRPDGTPFITISFNTQDKTITCSNASGEYSSTGQSVNLFTFQLANSQSSFATISTLQSRDEAFVFTQNIRLKIFEYDDVLVLKYTDNSKQFINITNIQGQTYIPTANTEVFDIKSTGLVKR